MCPLQGRTRVGPYTVVHLFKDPDRDRRQRFRFPARLDDGESRPGEREQQGGHPRAGDRHMQPDAARGGLAPQFLADDPPRPQQTLEAADVDDTRSSRCRS